MKIWHFILILALIAIPSSGTWLYYDLNRESEDSGLFGNIKRQTQPAPIPPVFWEDSIDVETTDTSTTTTDLADEVLSEMTTDKITNAVIEEFLEPLDDDGEETEPADLTPVKKAIPVEVEEDDVAEP